LTIGRSGRFEERCARLVPAERSGLLLGNDPALGAGAGVGAAPFVEPAGGVGVAGVAGVAGTIGPVGPAGGVRGSGGTGTGGRAGRVTGGGDGGVGVGRSTA
jgi:hypothetical protein